jgi:hypothetical protein
VGGRFRLNFTRQALSPWLLERPRSYGAGQLRNGGGRPWQRGRTHNGTGIPNEADAAYMAAINWNDDVYAETITIYEEPAVWTNHTVD